MSEEKKKVPSIDDQFKLLNDRHNNIYQFVMLYYNYIISKHDYGTGDVVSMIEAHTITFIEENPGTTVSELATYWNKTKGAMSQTITKLVDRQLIEKRQSVDNAKIQHLFVTEQGLKLSKAHKLYDTIDIAKTMEQLLEHCSVEEINAFFKVIKEYIILIKNDFE
ncbi:MarR family winged helix-turn-helix transcriptional regulator [Vagococcus humatus]|uniref:MarR family transcriptional regulator n=1 Tax=Vagococcus humatus TaxID=1889241 RepID=A0A3R9YWB3_9ENTE|nr:MarR family winged helix-turn-helix transcriptional regulator [Vagococcus humatus]RST88777.1 MarR family transcriptional regulator [Vagococcus humatus]